MQKQFTITDSRDGHTKTFTTGVFFDGSDVEHVHVQSSRVGCHRTMTVDKARAMFKAIIAANADKD